MWSLSVIKIFNHYFHRRSLWHIFFDLGLIVTAVIAAFHAQVSDSASDALVIVKVAFMLGFGVLVINTGLGLYQRHRTLTRKEVRLRALLAWGLSLPLAYLVFRMFPLAPRDERAFALALMSAMVLMLLHRLYAPQTKPAALSRHRVLVYGSGSRAKLVGSMLKASDPNIDLIGYYTSPNEEPTKSIGADMVATDQSLTDFVLKERVDEIVVALNERRGGSMPLRELLDCKLHGIKVVDVATHYEKTLGQIRREAVSAGWLIFRAGPHSHLGQTRV
jgi:FlaA1/EpsC-like NDP-sugar epimerase